jgi:hypothetical protein
MQFAAREMRFRSMMISYLTWLGVDILAITIHRRDVNFSDAMGTTQQPYRIYKLPELISNTKYFRIKSMYNSLIV